MATRTPATGRVAHVSHPILLDEMFSGAIAEELRAKGHDAQAVVTDPALISLPDDQVLARAAAAGRALVTANIKDFMPLRRGKRTEQLRAEEVDSQTAGPILQQYLGKARVTAPFFDAKLSDPVERFVAEAGPGIRCSASRRLPRPAEAWPVAAACRTGSITTLRRKSNPKWTLPY